MHKHSILQFTGIFTGSFAVLTCITFVYFLFLDFFSSDFNLEKIYYTLEPLNAPLMLTLFIVTLVIIRLCSLYYAAAARYALNTSKAERLKNNKITTYTAKVLDIVGYVIIALSILLLLTQIFWVDLIWPVNPRTLFIADLRPIVFSVAVISIGTVVVSTLRLTAKNIKDTVAF